MLILQGELVVEHSGLTEFWDVSDVEEEHLSEANHTKSVRNASVQTEQCLPDQPYHLSSAIVWLFMAGVLLGWGLCMGVLSMSSQTATAAIVVAALFAMAPVIEIHRDMLWDHFPPHLDALLTSAQAAQTWIASKAITGVSFAVAFMHLGCRRAAAAVAAAFMSILAAGKDVMHLIQEVTTTIIKAFQAFYLQGKTAGARFVLAIQTVPSVVQQAIAGPLHYRDALAAWSSAAAKHTVSAVHNANMSTK